MRNTTRLISKNKRVRQMGGLATDLILPIGGRRFQHGDAKAHSTRLAFAPYPAPLRSRRRRLKADASNPAPDRVEQVVKARLGVWAIPARVLLRRNRIPALGEVQTRQRFRRWSVARSVLLSLLPVVFLLAACGKTPASASEVVVLLGSGTRNEPAAVLAPTDLAVLSRAGANSTGAVAYVVDPNTGQPTEVPLTPRRGDGQVEFGPDRDQLLAGNVSRVQRLLGREAADRPFDLLSWIAAAVRVTSSPGMLIVVSSGLSTSGGFDLQQVGWGADPSAVSAQLKDRGLLPDLARWQVMFSGLGDTTWPQPALPLPQRAELTAYWLAICRAAGAASCSTDGVTRPAPPVAQHNPGSPCPGPGGDLRPGSAPLDWQERTRRHVLRIRQRPAASRRR